MPKKVEKITTLIIDVGLAPARSANGFLGINDNIN